MCVSVIVCIHILQTFYVCVCVCVHVCTQAVSFKFHVNVLYMENLLSSQCFVYFAQDVIWQARVHVNDDSLTSYLITGDNLVSPCQLV